jgi:hypothetical protein
MAELVLRGEAHLDLAARLLRKRGMLLKNSDPRLASGVAGRRPTNGMVRRFYFRAVEYEGRGKELFPWIYTQLALI